jgi:LmbE family N-acetylglucosaminyl deacetylase
MIKPISGVIPEKNITLLSPHYDDVVLTFGGYLDALVSNGLLQTKQISIIHVFSRTNYQLRDEEGNRDPSLERIQYATGIRLLEDLNCLDDLIGQGNYTYEILAEKECMLRQKSWKEGEVFEFPEGGREDFEEEDWAIYTRIKTAARRWLLSGDTAILLPLGIKEHIDHILLREAVMDAREDLGQEARAAICFGEDQPYAGLASETDWKKALAFVHKLRTQKVDYPIDAERKSDLIMKHYPSQVEESYREGVLNRAESLRLEHGGNSGMERMYRRVP